MNCQNINSRGKLTGRLVVLSIFLAVLIIVQSAYAVDWPTYRLDNARSGSTPEALILSELNQAWVYSAPSPPKRAWGDDPPWDAWSYNGAVPMRDFDTALFVTVVGQDVYFGSSVTNSVHCLNVITGLQKWYYRTDGAVRLPPSFDNGKLYFGSDDGYVYCINAADGSFVWKYSPVGEGRVLFNNGNFTTMWPVRTGTAVMENKVYFAAGLVPWESSYLCSVDALTGSDSGTGLYKKTVSSTPTGAILASATKLYLTEGRFKPICYDRTSGGSAVTLGSGAGVFALLTSDGPSEGYAFGLGRFSAHGYRLETYADRIASQADGKCMVVGEGFSYVITESFNVETVKGYKTNIDNRLNAIDRSDGSEAWSVVCDTRCFDMVLADDIIFVGGVGEVVAYSTADGSVLWSKPVNGQVRGLAVANSSLFASTDTGKIYMFGSPYLQSDFNKSGMVDLVDLMMLMGNFLDCTDPLTAGCSEVNP
ncbi:MAG: PQQ-binding-like beta-propeller repeat protein [Sedimentisphaerales bacterium]|nr:PQQ-binding-like beta-propeller repeat protein [Sedimentisphaerales bacterium]